MYFKLGAQERLTEPQQHQGANGLLFTPEFLVSKQHTKYKPQNNPEAS